MMMLDSWSLYALVLKSRLFEEATAKLWHDSLISGEMHLGTGEEGVMAGIVPQLREGDAMALDHRGTAALLMRGVDPILILRELLGRADGLCGGMGGRKYTPVHRLGSRPDQVWYNKAAVGAGPTVGLCEFAWRQAVDPCPDRRRP
jgi:TPP-dependent pyruvate/acetoin dehydrogenase alpha subunit